ncbi:hypothetical protein [Azoarcus olearius]|uniref:Conserved hypothetical secreted protein n=1 Tax=Azoarcus sp. (strain BH72) TaxID=418699 RepID=A1K755_AZOSB|nr:hypothetical protein [Azoarcus olearius]CAL94660.1 conserved hypothetical secreted protein [Azoarcus olearius]
MKPAYSMIAVFSACVSSTHADVLDGVIFGVKCIGAADRAACEARSRREADETRERMRHQPEARVGQSSARTSSADEETIGKRLYRNWMENIVCRDFAKRSPRDVDSTYARAMRHYNFMTPKQIVLQPLTTEAGLQTAGYLHEATPGALYRLEQVVHSPDVANGRRQYKLILDIGRDGSGTHVSGRYCVTTDDPAGWQDLLPQVRASLNNVF